MSLFIQYFWRLIFENQRRYRAIEYHNLALCGMEYKATIHAVRNSGRNTAVITGNSWQLSPSTRLLIVLRICSVLVI